MGTLVHASGVRPAAESPGSLGGESRGAGGNRSLPHRADTGSPVYNCQCSFISSCLLISDRYRTKSENLTSLPVTSLPASFRYFRTMSLP